VNAATLLTDDTTSPRLLHSFIRDHVAFRISSPMLKKLFYDIVCSVTHWNHMST